MNIRGMVFGVLPVGWLINATCGDLRTQVLTTAAIIIITSVPCRIALSLSIRERQKLGLHLQPKRASELASYITAQRATGWRKETTSSTSFTHNHDRGSAERQIGKEDSGEVQ
jgi:hypothetical protein